MDYFIKGRLEIQTDEQLAALQAAQGELRNVTFKNGWQYRADYQGQRNDVYTLEARTYTQPEGYKAFVALKKLIDDHAFPGWVGWHECTHDADGLPCSWNELYEGGEL